LVRILYAFNLASVGERLSVGEVVDVLPDALLVAPERPVRLVDEAYLAAMGR
jgi:hypothetical protein